MDLAAVDGLIEARQAISVTYITTYTYLSTATSYSYYAYPSTISVYPLTSVFTPPASCFDRVFTLGSLTGTNAGFDSYYTYGNGASTYPASTTDIFRTAQSACFPPNYQTSSVFSPGICPAGYSTATFGGDASRTTATCCPSGYNTYSNYQYCTLNAATVTIANGSLTSTVSIGTVFVPQIAVAFQPSELASLTATTTSSTSSSTTTSATSTTTSSTGGGGLSTGAQAGIGVGVAVGVLAILGAFLVFFLMRRKKRQQLPPSYSSPAPGQHFEPKSMREVDQNPRHSGLNPAYEIQNS